MAGSFPEQTFLLAFDRVIERVCQDLASSGIDQDAIWAGFRKATIAMGQLAVEVEDEELSSGILKTDVRRNRSGRCHRRARRTVSSSARRKGTG
jgi:hypothetical protein